MLRSKVFDLMIPTDFFVFRTLEILKTFEICSFFYEKWLLSHVLRGAKRPVDVCPAPTEAKRRPWTVSSSQAFASEKEKSQVKPETFLFLECGWWDLNPHDRETGRFWVCCVCHSATSAYQRYYLAEQEIVYHTFSCLARCIFKFLRKIYTNNDSFPAFRSIWKNSSK